MLIITGLVTLLAIAQAGGEHYIKGGSRVKGGSLTQEQVSQEDIPTPHKFNIKTGPAYGSKVAQEGTGDVDGRIKGSYTVSDPKPTPKVIQQRADDTGFHANVKTSEPSSKMHAPARIKTESVSKTAPALALHHTVKMMTDRSRKTQHAPGLHHAPTSPFVQDQVAIDEPVADTFSTKGIKTQKPVSSEGTRFSQVDKQVRDPVSRPVIQTVKTVEEPVLQTRDIKTLKTAATGKTRFSPQDKQLRDTTVRPVIQTVQRTDNPITESIKTQKTSTRGKTRFSQKDTQVRDPVAHPVAQTVKTVDVPSITLTKKTVKTTTKTVEPSNLRTKTAIKSSQQKVDSSSDSTIPESIVEIARKNTLRTLIPQEAMSQRPSASDGRQDIQFFNSGSQIQAGFGIVNEKGEIMLDEDGVKLLQNAGGIVKDSGEITLNEGAIRVLQNIGSSSIDQSSPVFFTASNENAASRSQASGEGRQPDLSYLRADIDRKQDTIASRPLLRVTEPGQTRRVSSPNRRVQISSGVAASGVNTRSGISLSSGNVDSNIGISEGDKIVYRLTSSERRTGTQNIQLRSDGTPFSQYPAAGNTDRTASGNLNIRGGTVLQRTPGLNAEQSLSRQPKPARTYGYGTHLRNQHHAVNIPKDKVKMIIQAESPVHRHSTSTGDTLRSQGITTNEDTVLFNGKEISISGLQEGQIFDENLRPISSSTIERAKSEDFKSSIVNQSTKPKSLPEFSRGVVAPATGSIYGTRTVLTGGGARSRQQVDIIPKDKVKLSTPARTSITLSGHRNAETSVPKSPSRSQGAAGVRQPTTSANAEKIFFNGKEISISGLREGQIFDENLQPLLTDKPGRAKPEDIKTPITHQNIKPASFPVLTQSGVISAVSSSSGSGTLLARGVTRSRQQAVNIPKDKVKLRTASGQRNTQASISRAALRSQGATGVRQSTTSTNAETIFFNGKEISISGLREGQLFDENLQPLLTDNTGNVRPTDVRASTFPQSVKPAHGAIVPKFTSDQRSRKPITGSSQILSTSEHGLLNNKHIDISPGISRSTSQVSLTPDVNTRTNTDISQIPKLIGRVTEFSGQPISSVFGSRGTVYSRNQQLHGKEIAQIPAVNVLETSGKRLATSDTIDFNGKEINIDGLKAGQLFDENLRPISPEISDPKTWKEKSLFSAAQTSGIRSPSGTDIQKPTIHRIHSSAGGELRRTSQGPAVNTPSTRHSISSSGISTNTGSTSFQSPSSIGLRRSGASTLKLRSRTESVETTTARRQGSSETTSSQSGATLQSGMFSSRGIPSTNSRISGTTSSRIPAGFRTGASLPQHPTGGHRKPNIIPQMSPEAILQSQGGILSGDIGLGPSEHSGRQIAFGLVSSGNHGQTTPQMRTSGPGLSQGLRVESLRTNGVQSQQQAANSRTSVESPNRFIGQSVPDINKPTIAANTDTVFFNGKEISIGGLREGQLFDENLQPILAGNTESDKIHDVKAFVTPQNVRSAGRPGISQNSAVHTIGSNYESRIFSTSGVTQRRQQAANAAKDKLKLRTPQESPLRVSAQPVVSRATVRSQGMANIRQPTTGINADTILFNGKEIRIRGLRAGQIFDENLKPIASDNSGSVNAEDIKASQHIKPGSHPGIGNSGSSEYILSGTLPTGGFRGQGSSQSSAASGLRIGAQLQGQSAESTRRAGSGLRRQPVSGQSSQTPNFRSTAFSADGISSSIGISSSPQNRNFQTVGAEPSDSLTNIGVSRSTGSQVSSHISPSDISITGFADQSGILKATQNASPGILQLNSGDTVSKYSSVPGSRRLGSRQKISQDRITQEIAQDRVEVPVIQQKQEVPITPQYLVDEQQKILVNDPTTKTFKATTDSGSVKVHARKLSQKTLEPSKQTQLKVEDVLEQRFVTKPEVQKTVQVQETIPFSVEASPKTASRTTLTKISQVSQKDIDVPIVQQELIPEYFAGYLPKASFLPPFNYRIPQMSSPYKYGGKTPIVQEQQKVEQVFL